MPNMILVPYCIGSTSPHRAVVVVEGEVTLEIQQLFHLVEGPVRALVVYT